MPNHCHNDLYIQGDENAVSSILAFIKTDDMEIDFNKIIPYPKRFSDLDAERESLGCAGFAEKYGARAKDGYNSGGYEWCLANWGTKWNAYRQARRDYEGVCITFQTAWSAPSKVVQELHRKFPEATLRLEWFEAGMSKCGGFTCYSKDDHEGYEEEGEWKAGDMMREWSGEYSGHRGG